MNTPALIKTQFLKDITTKPLESINVSSLCNILKIKRQTFYYYYRDIYDLVESIFKDYQDDLFNIEPNSFFLVKMLDFCNEMMLLINQCVIGGLEPIVFNFFKNLLLTYVFSRLQNLSEAVNLSHKDLDEIANYHSNAIAYLIIDEVRKNKEMDTGRVTNKIEIFINKEILTHTVLEYFDKRKII